MKKFILTISLILPAILLLAQSDKYKQAMVQHIGKIESAFQSGNFLEIANSFERIGDAEKTQWLPYYYASYCQVISALVGTDKSKSDVLADKADALITKAETIAGGSNSETNVIRSMIASAHMMVDPQSRWQQYGQVSAGHIEKAKEQDPTNPRPVYLEGQSKFYTPEAFGGGKAIAAPLFEKALSMFDTFKPATEIAPSWGKASTQYFLSQCK
ncbi:hypothetical protein [Flavihumibacter fluvii]|uniref:hypothetical protein n=1 Tax=Flavihumibacter fluvii TaxID=2838157 RepID=UPI001BDE3BFA|nr:hypothetical protein [Flavihumibacter fluvii]ULQ52513.1 hypothetical protein KJS93_20705 [Flavihumibacter fluvii]